MIRRADTDDIDELAGLYSKYRVDMEFPNAHHDAQWYICNFVNNTSRGIFVEVSTSGKILGFLTYQETLSSTCCGPSIFLLDLWVIPEFRRQGVARRLFEFVCSIAKEQKYSTIAFFGANQEKALSNFYISMGFKSPEVPLWRMDLPQS